VAEPPDAAFAHAVRVKMQMGGTLWRQDPQTRTLQTFLNYARTSLNVIVHARGQGSRLEVMHQNLPTYVVAGDVGTLSDDFLALYTQHTAQP
jgi:hypothetical protein